MSGPAPELVTLNVGGRLFTTTRSTLTKHPDSMLAAMFRGDMQAGLADGQGHPFLDRDPTHFPTILAFLRDNQVPPLPEGRPERQQLKMEAGFFALSELVAAIEGAEAAEAAAEAAAEEAAAAAEAAAEASAAPRRKRAAAEQEAEWEHAKVRRFLESQRAEQLKAACTAVDLAQQRYLKAESDVSDIREMERRALRLKVRLEEGADMFDGQEGLGEQLEDLLKAIALNREYFPHHVAEAEAARVALRQAHLVKLCALGHDMATAEKLLASTHPEPEKLPAVR